MVKYYTLLELQTHSFDDKEINELLNNNNIVKHCILAMFRFVKSNYSDDKIFEFVKTDNWMNKKHWTWKEHDKFINALALVYKNIYQYGNQEATRMAQDFVYKYGFIVKDTLKNEDKHLKNICKYEL